MDDCLPKGDVIVQIKRKGLSGSHDEFVGTSLRRPKTIDLTDGWFLSINKKNGMSIPSAKSHGGKRFYNEIVAGVQEVEELGLPQVLLSPMKQMKI